MKKFFLSFFVFAASAGYVVYQYLGGSPASASIASQTPSAVNTAQTVPTTPAATTNAAPAQTTPAASNQAPTTNPSTPAPAPTPTPSPAPKPKGQYNDGSYTGSVADAYYGNVEVRATISGGRLTAVDFLQYPSDRRTSQYINAQAMPLLKTEAIQAQSANVSGVSGATDTSQAFRQSLGNALSQAKA